VRWDEGRSRWTIRTDRKDVISARSIVLGTGLLHQSLGLRPLDTGDLKTAHWLEGAGLLMVDLVRHAVGHNNFWLGINTSG
jgi:predicted dinucleotide-binding enzyme